MADSIKFSKRTLILIILIILAIALLAVYLFYYAPKQKKQNEINDYKKSLYESILCQYECPMKNYTFEENQTQLLQDRDCVVACIGSLKTKGYVKDQYSNNEINSDSLAQDIDFVVSNCRKENVNNSTKVVDNQAITNCAIEGLRALKQTYKYLN